MTTCITKCIILAILSIAMRPGIVIRAQQVPCYFIFGDSLFDNGNNNNLVSLAKANYLPYGIDYISGPTGRFTNGANIPDFLAQRLGFSSPIPPHATAGQSNTILRGLNYASGAAGILVETSYQVLDRIWMDRQLSYHQETVNRISTLLGNQTAANNLLNRCLYTVSMGNNDYINNYYFTLPLTLSRLLTPEAFAEKLIQKYSQQLTTLYGQGARKVAIFGVVPVGCLPNSVSQFPTNGARCVENINDGVMLFNKKLISLIQDLNTKLAGASFTYINTFPVFSPENLSSIGVTVPNSPCCEVSVLTLGLCVRNGRVCSNRNNHAFFDNYHPTQVVANFTALRAYNAPSPSDAIPFDIATLVQN